MKLQYLAVLLLATSVVCFTTTPAGAQAPPKQTTVEILHPAAGQTLSGPIAVCLKSTPKLSGDLQTHVYAGLGGPPWVKMNRIEDTDVWQCRLDTTLVPNGGHNLMIVTGNKRVGTAVSVRVENPMRCFFADLHSHTRYSDGTLLPVVAHEYARDVSELDVFSLTDHLEQIDDAEWADTREVAQKANRDGEFIVILGLEWTKKQGHINIFDPKTRHWPNDTAGFYQAIADAGVVAKFNHPGDGTKVFDGLAYSEIGDRAMQLMEVRHPDEEKAFLRALAAGWHIAPDGSDDTHDPNWGNNHCWTGIIAPGLSQRTVWHALKNRHVFSTLDRSCELFFTVNGATMGDIIAEPAETVEIVATVREEIRGIMASTGELLFKNDDPTAKIELFEDGAVVQTVEPKANAYRWEVTCKPKPGGHYYFVKVTQADGDVIRSAPVWITVAEEPEPVKPEVSGGGETPTPEPPDQDS